MSKKKMCLVVKVVEKNETNYTFFSLSFFFVQLLLFSQTKVAHIQLSLQKYPYLHHRWYNWCVLLSFYCFEKTTDDDDDAFFFLINERREGKDDEEGFETTTTLPLRVF